MSIVFSNSLFYDAGSFTADRIMQEATEKNMHLESLPSIAFFSDDPRVLLENVLYLYRSKKVGLVATKNRLSSNLSEKLRDMGFSVVVDGNILKPANPSAKLDNSDIYILTSGTTGDPKVIGHTWESLNTHKHTREIKPRRWAVTYLPGTYAWFQMVTMWMFVEGQNLILSSDPAPEGVISEAIKCGATAISSTPTFWRYIFLKTSISDLQKIPFNQISLGGEYVDQRILNDLKRIYINAQITHIYASTEMGVAIVVNDGLEGFPLSWVDDPKRGISIKDNTLYLNSKNSSKEFASLYDTKDKVEIRDNRVVIVGRQDVGLINVGGQKVPSSQIEGILLKNQKISWCRVYGRKSFLTNQIVAAEIVPKEKIHDMASFELELVEYCKENGLADWMIPRMWKFVDTIKMNSNYKTEKMV